MCEIVTAMLFPHADLSMPDSASCSPHTLSTRPYIIVNVAMSADGKLSTKERRQVIISGKEDFSRVDELKAGCDAIMVGIGTVLADDPSLTVKSETRVKERRSNFRPPHPIRIVVDSMARTPLGAKILHKGEGKRIIAVSRAADPVRVDQLRQVAMHSSDDIEIECIFCGEDQVDLVELCKELKMRDIHTLMVEGGGTLIMGLFQVGLIDELHTFIGNMIIGGKNAPTLADGDGFVFENEFIRLTLHTVSQMEDGVLVSWYVHGCS